jgi:hypothetical protein
MKIYIYDDSGGQTKDWSSLCGPHFQPIVEVGGHFVFADGDRKPLNLINCVVVLHGPIDHEHAAIKTTVKALEANPTACAVVVSGGGLTTEKPHERLYFRRTPVERKDTVFERLFKDFIKDIERSGGNTPNFELLEPTAVPEPILAYAVAVHYGFGEWKLKALRSAADDAYNQLHSYTLTLLPSKKNAFSFPDVGLPKVAEFEHEPSAHSEAVSKRFKAMRNLIDVLREDL